MKKEANYIYNNHKRLELLVISWPTWLDQEFNQVNEMFKAGLTGFHLRKPGYSKRDYLEALRQINPSFINRVMLHDHYALAGKYNVKGLHLTGSLLSKTPPDKLDATLKAAKKRGLKISKGVHSLREIKESSGIFDYLLLSPVFNSISKPGYTASIDLEETARALGAGQKSKVMALGGIEPENAEQIVKTGFNGAAVLGTIWKSQDPVGRFVELKNNYFF